MLSITPKTESITIDQREIESFAVDAQSPAIVVRYADGYQDAAGKFTPVQHNTYRIPQEAIATVMGFTTSGETIYDAIKASLYAALPVVQTTQDDGLPVEDDLTSTEDTTTDEAIANEPDPEVTP